MQVLVELTGLIISLVPSYSSFNSHGARLAIYGHRRELAVGSCQAPQRVRGTKEMMHR